MQEVALFVLLPPTVLPLLDPLRIKLRLQICKNLISYAVQLKAHILALCRMEKYAIFETDCKLCSEDSRHCFFIIFLLLTFLTNLS
jgi:hypothetical protein